MRWARVTMVAWLACVSSASAQSAPDAGKPFRVKPVSQRLYDVKFPEEDPARQRHFVTAADGTQIWTETWLPKARDGNVPPAELPTVVNYSPYLSPGFYGSVPSRILETVVERGYAYTIAHARGTGGSGGCRDDGLDDIDDGARVIEYVGRDAPWSDGNVGMYGLSYNAAVQVAIAGLGNPAKTKYLKAIVPLATATSLYDFLFQDGVPLFVMNNSSTVVGFAGHIADWFGTADPAAYPNRVPCEPAAFVNHQNPDGNYTEYYASQDFRRGVKNIRAATLLAHGFADIRVRPISVTGFFERLPRKTPKAGVFGVWSHDAPDEHYFENPKVRPEWERADWRDMVVAWYDRHLKGLDSGVGRWPVAQIQASDGQWRAAKKWPQSGSRAELPLSDLAPGTSTSYVEGEFENTQTAYLPGTSAVFETSPADMRFVVGGQPMLDAWVTLDRPDAHLAAKLEVVDEHGAVVPRARATGLRSMRHLEPLRHGAFGQHQGEVPPILEPVRVRLRFDPTELAIPPGGRLRLTLAGSVYVFDGLAPNEPTAGAILYGPSQPSGTATRVTIHHDAAHPSALRFHTPGKKPKLIDVLEKDEL